MWLNFIHPPPICPQFFPDVLSCKNYDPLSLMSKLILQQPHPARGSLALIKHACVCRVWVRVKQRSADTTKQSTTPPWPNRRWWRVLFTSNLFVSFPCTCSRHSRLGIKMNEPPVVFFILSARAVIKTAAVCIVVAGCWCDWYDVKARGKCFLVSN